MLLLGAKDNSWDKQAVEVREEKLGREMLWAIRALESAHIV